MSGYSPKQEVRWQTGRGQKPQGQSGRNGGGRLQRGERGPPAGQPQTPTGTGRAKPKPQPRAPAGGPLPRRCGGESPPWPRHRRRLFRRRRLLRVLRGSASAGRCRRRHEAGGGGRCGAGGMAGRGGAGRGQGLRRLRGCRGTAWASWSSPALSCPPMTYHDISRHIITYHVLLCPSLPCPAVSPAAIQGGSAPQPGALTIKAVKYLFLALILYILYPPCGEHKELEAQGMQKEKFLLRSNRVFMSPPCLWISAKCLTQSCQYVVVMVTCNKRVLPLYNKEILTIKTGVKK